MKRFFTLFFAVVYYIAPAQTDLEKAKEQLKNLKEGFILVRLQTQEKKIEILEKQGYSEEAEEIRQEQYQENRETILSFTQTFDFCPVYFFYADKSEQIRAGDLTGNVFNSERQLVEDGEKLSARPFFTAEFAETDNLGIKALVLMDQNMIPLEAPFPFYQRTYVFFSLIRQSKATVVSKYNERLHSYYHRWHGKAQ